MERLIGFSTGCLFKEPIDMAQKIRAIRDIGCNAIELGYLKIYHLLDGADRLSNAVDILKDFQHVSLHAPSHTYGNDPGTLEIFEKIKWINSLRPLDLIVVHPHEVLDFSVFDKLKIPVAFENMDGRKNNYITGDKFVKLFTDYPQHKLLLDVAHIYSVDFACCLANDFEQLADKIAEVHLSGYNSHHIPLFQTKQIKLIKLADRFAPPAQTGRPNTPIIIESVLSLKEMEKELDYIKKHLN